MRKIFSVVSAVIALTAVATGCGFYQPGYRPVVDTYRDPNAFRVAQDERECRQLAAGAGKTAGTKSRASTGDESRSAQVDSRFKHAFIDCMAERGHEVVN